MLRTGWRQEKGVVSASGNGLECAVQLSVAAGSVEMIFDRALEAHPYYLLLLATILQLSCWNEYAGEV